LVPPFYSPGPFCGHLYIDGVWFSACLSPLQKGLPSKGLNFGALPFFPIFGAVPRFILVLWFQPFLSDLDIVFCLPLPLPTPLFFHFVPGDPHQFRHTEDFNRINIVCQPWPLLFLSPWGPFSSQLLLPPSFKTRLTDAPPSALSTTFSVFVDLAFFSLDFSMLEHYREV